MWRTYSARVKSAPPDGAQVFVFGIPTVWEERGEFRLNVTELLITDQLGQQQLELERIRRALEKDGLFDPARKRPLPALPERIAVVTSLDGAALRDIITVSRRRWPAVQLLVVGTKVQGMEAEAELVRALGIVNRLEGVDLCVVGRGGGSREDLAVFNTEAVCRALAAVKVPTISAVGHETDVSLSDLVADVRAATPSAAMELAVPDRADLARQVAALGFRLGRALGRGTRLAGERLARSGDRLEAALARQLERPGGTSSGSPHSSTPSLRCGCSNGATAWHATRVAGSSAASPTSRPDHPSPCALWTEMSPRGWNRDHDQAGRGVRLIRLTGGGPQTSRGNRPPAGA